LRRLGFHISCAGGLQNVVPRALARHCNALQLFTSAPSQWARREIGAEEADTFREAMRAEDVGPYFVHAIYLLNLASPQQGNWKRSVDHLTGELRRAELLGAAGVILHLGSVGEGGSRKQGVRRVARALREARERAECEVPLLLENGSGSGNTLGGQLEEIAAIRTAAEKAEPLGLALDTAHAFVAGWEVHTEEGLAGVLEEMRRTGEERALRVVHYNDARGGLGSHRDRHWHIGEGTMGRESMRRLLNLPAWAQVPYIMETPGSEEDDRRNMYRVRRWLSAEERPPLRRRPARVP
jgi:deoxyribonuclease-4